MENQKTLLNIIDKETRKLVGILCKRIEVLDKNKVLTANLYKDLSKELIYEWSRQLKEVLRIGRVEFISPKKQDKLV